MKGAPDLYKAIVFMKDNGFAVYDILEKWYRSLDNSLGQIYIVFVKGNGILIEKIIVSRLIKIKKS